MKLTFPWFFSIFCNDLASKFRVAVTNYAHDPLISFAALTNTNLNVHFSSFTMLETVKNGTVFLLIVSSKLNSSSFGVVLLSLMSLKTFTITPCSES